MSTPHDDLDARVRQALTDLPAKAEQSDKAESTLLTLFDAMAGSRHIDIEARRMRERGQGFYTIGSAGHESNALVASTLRPSDPALLHYRSGAFYLARSAQAGRKLEDGLRDILLGMMGAVDDPASGGRHKVFGNPDLAIIPQTSTIASHLPRALGVAFAIPRGKRLGVPLRWPSDAVAITSFGDASLNHSTAVGALNTIGYSVRQGLPLPLLLVCEDNGLGISVPTPEGWIAEMARRPGIEYMSADGADPDAVRATALLAASYVRTRRRPALLHLRTVRFLGHAGTDVESAYRTPDAITSDLKRDPLLALARRLGARDLAARYDEIGQLVRALGEELRGVRTLTTARMVTEPLAPRRPPVIASEAGRFADTDVRRAAFSGRMPEQAGELTLAQCINAALTDALAARPEVLVFGEDVGVKGGVYGITRGLQQRFRSTRVFDTLLDEQSILGLGLGLGVSGLLPIPEIQYLAYLHNAEDQLRGEAASLRFFSNGTFTNPMVVRIAGLGYQKGFGGHFHNDNGVAALRDIPGLVVAVPSRPDDAGPMLRSCIAAGLADGQVSVFLEPIALYHERDLLSPGDRGWLGAYSLVGHVPIGSARTHTDGTDLTVLTFGNGLRMSLRVAALLADEGIRLRVVDLRWLMPLPVDDILREANATGRVLVVDETRHSGGVGEGIVTALVEGRFGGPIARVSSADSYVPLGDAANTVLISEDDIERGVRKLLG
ncbi:MAG TPA: thiamine pyrophosphate-dependent enzyme [Jatrophihabitantaceae bacterium]